MRELSASRDWVYGIKLPVVHLGLASILLYDFVQCIRRKAGWLEFLLTCVICGYVYMQLLILNIPMLD